MAGSCLHTLTPCLLVHREGQKKGESNPAALLQRLRGMTDATHLGGTLDTAACEEQKGWESPRAEAG